MCVLDAMFRWDLLRVYDRGARLGYECGLPRSSCNVHARMYAVCRASAKRIAIYPPKGRKDDE